MQVSSTIQQHGTPTRRGQIAVRPGAERTFSKEQMVEESAEMARLYAEVRQFRRTRDRAWQQRNMELLEAMVPKAIELAAQLRYTVAAYHRHGTYPVWYQVASGAVHTTAFCRTINRHTHFTSLTKYTGDTVDQMEERGYRICSHCKKRPKLALLCKIERRMDAWDEYLKGDGSEPAKGLD